MRYLAALAAVALALVPCAPAGAAARVTAVGARIDAPVGDHVHLHVGLRNHGPGALRAGEAVVRLPANVAVLAADRHCVRHDEFSDSSYRCRASSVAPGARALFTFDVRIRKAGGGSGEVTAGDRAAIVVTGTDGAHLRIPAQLPGPFRGAGGFAVLGGVLLVAGLGGLIRYRRRAV